MLILDVFGIGETIVNVFRWIMMAIDNVVFYFVEIVYQLIMDLANVEIFTQTTINTFAKRIYVILGLVMVFKMMISFVQILINPDTMTDKEKGLSSVLKRVVISLILIVLVPSIFKTAREIQRYVLPVIPRVIMGVQGDDENEDMEGKVGRAVAWYSFLPFFDYAGTCNDGSINSYFEDENSQGSSSDVMISSVNDALLNINRQDKTCGSGTYHYFYDHKMLISTAVGVYLLFTLVQVAIQVAIRAIKFGICEFIAPIPIASYIDPKTSKSTFDKWVNTSIKVYLDLFIQLIVVYFVAFVFVTIADADNIKIIVANTGGSFGRAALVILFIIIGLFKFVKEFPKFLSGLLGLGTDGAIGQIFKGAWSGAQTTGRWVGGTADAFRSNYISQKERLKSQGKSRAKLKAFGSALAGVGSYQARMVGGKIKGKSGKDLTSSAFQGVVSARNKRNYNKDVVFTNGYKKKDYRLERSRQRLGIPSGEDFAINRHSAFSKMFSSTDSAAKHGLSKMYDTPANLTVTYEDKDHHMHTQTLADVKALAAREEGKIYKDINGQQKTWTSDDVAFWSDNLRRIEKNAQYVKEAELLKKGDSAAVQNWKNTQENFKSNMDLFNTSINGTNAFELFRDAYNYVADSNEQLTDLASLKNLIESSSVSATQLQALKTATEKMQTITSDESVAASKRKESNNAAKQNNGK